MNVDFPEFDPSLQIGLTMKRSSPLQVHLCEADGLLEFLGRAPPEVSSQAVLVAVKMLRANVTKTAR